MCWNAEVSLQSFLIGITAVFVAYQKGLSLPMTLFCLTIAFMQLIEYFVWRFYENKKVNYYASISAIVLLWLQCLASILTLPSSLFFSFLFPFLGLSFLGVTLFPSTKEELSMYKGENGHLVWAWLQKDKKTAIELAIYFFFLLTPLVIAKQYLLLGVSLTTLAASLYSFYESNTWGSMWCWIVNYIVVGVAANQVLTPWIKSSPFT